MAIKQKITTYLWFDANAEEAVEHYTSIFPHSQVTQVARYGTGGPGPEGTVMNIEFELAGQRFMALNGGPQYRFTPAISLFVSCESQEEVDRYWNRFLEAGGKETACGWLDDKFGLSWQIIPTELPKLLTDPDPKKAARVMDAMLAMKKIDVAALRRAHAGA